MRTSTNNKSVFASFSSEKDESRRFLFPGLRARRSKGDNEPSLFSKKIKSASFFEKRGAKLWLFPRSVIGMSSDCRSGAVAEASPKMRFAGSFSQLWRGLCMKMRGGNDAAPGGLEPMDTDGLSAEAVLQPDKELPTMRIAAGYEISFDCQQATPMMLVVNVHPSRAGDLLSPGTITVAPANTLSTYYDSFGNICTRVTVPPGHTTVSTSFEIADSGLPDIVNWNAAQHPVEDLPDGHLLFLLGSRYCETQRLMDIAWQLFGHTPPGYARVAAVCDFVHHHIKFDYQSARATRTALEAYHEGVGVCRDFAHLAITFCRCLNIPARYCTGYLGDIGVPVVPLPGDFSAWFDVYLGGEWYTFDARHNTPRIGRILMARGRDATDVAISTIFGPHALTRFNVWCDEVK